MCVTIANTDKLIIGCYKDCIIAVYIKPGRLAGFRRVCHVIESKSHPTPKSKDTKVPDQGEMTCQRQCKSFLCWQTEQQDAPRWGICTDIDSMKYDRLQPRPTSGMQSLGNGTELECLKIPETAAWLERPNLVIAGIYFVRLPLSVLSAGP